MAPAFGDTFALAVGLAAGLGVVFGVVLYFAGKYLAVEQDPRIDQVEEALSGANCGGCAYAGCRAYAEAIVLKGVSCELCAPGGASTSSAIAAIMGVAAGAVEKKVAVVKCRGGRDDSTLRARYYGVEDCRAALLPGVHAPKACEFGCLGYGTCARECPFEAMVMGPDDLPVVVESRCTGCGRCAQVCPLDIIELLPVSKAVHVMCCSKGSGGAVRRACEVGCIGCKKCVKPCPEDAIQVVDFLAVIDYEKCKSCGECVASCPRNIVYDLREMREALPPEAVECPTA